MQKAVKSIKSPIVITEDDQNATVSGIPEGATHIVNLSPDFEDEEVAEEAVRAQEARDASSAEKTGRAGLAEGEVVRKSTKCTTSSAVFIEPKPKLKARARPKFLAKWFIEAFGNKGVPDAALAAAVASTVPFSFESIPEGDEAAEAVGTPCQPSAGAVAHASQSLAGTTKVVREVVAYLSTLEARSHVEYGDVAQFKTAEDWRRHMGIEPMLHDPAWYAASFDENAQVENCRDVGSFKKVTMAARAYGQHLVIVPPEEWMETLKADSKVQFRTQLAGCWRGSPSP